MVALSTTNDNPCLWQHVNAATLKSKMLTMLLGTGPAVKQHKATQDRGFAQTPKCVRHLGHAKAAMKVPFGSIHPRSRTNGPAQ